MAAKNCMVVAHFCVGKPEVVMGADGGLMSKKDAQRKAQDVVTTYSGTIRRAEVVEQVLVVNNPERDAFGAPVSGI